MIPITSPRTHGAADLKKPRELAYKTAANADVVIMEVRSIRRSGNRALITGRIPAASLEGTRGVSDGPISIRARSVGPLYLAQPETSPVLGLLIVHRPVTLISGTAPDDSDWLSVSLEVSAALLPSNLQTLGPVCCAWCNEPIPPKRLRAKPDAALCTPCQTQLERRSHGRNA